MKFTAHDPLRRYQGQQPEYAAVWRALDEVRISGFVGYGVAVRLEGAAVQFGCVAGAERGSE